MNCDSVFCLKILITNSSGDHTTYVFTFISLRKFRGVTMALARRSINLAILLRGAYLR